MNLPLILSLTFIRLVTTRLSRNAMQFSVFIVKKKVCHITHGLVGSGVETVIFNYCSRMMDEFQFDVLYQYDPNPDVLSKFQNAGFNCIRVPSKVRYPLKHVWTVYKIFKTNRYEIVHSHLDYFMNSYVCFLAMLAGVKKRIAHHHQAYTLSSKRTVKLLIRKVICAFMNIPCKLFATDWLACSEAAAIDGWGRRAVNKGKVVVLPNAIDEKRFEFNEQLRQKIRGRYGFAENDFVVGHVGRFFPQKNHGFLIDVFAELHSQKANAKLLLLGNGPLQDHIKQKVQSLGLSNAVIFAGMQKDPAPFYSAMDIFAFPSLWEGLGIVLIEAQYNGLPCIVNKNIPKDARISSDIYFVDESVNQWVLMMLKKRRVDGKDSLLAA